MRATNDALIKEVQGDIPHFINPQSGKSGPINFVKSRNRMQFVPVAEGKYQLIVDGRKAWNSFGIKNIKSLTREQLERGDHLFTLDLKAIEQTEKVPPSGFFPTTRGISGRESLGVIR